MRNLGQLNDLPSKVIPQQRLRHTVESWACDCWSQPLPKISLECLHWCNNAQQCSTMFKNMQPSSHAVKLCHIMSLLYTVVVSANEPHDLQWLEVCGSRRGDYLFLRTFEGGPMCRSWSQIEPNWAKFSTSLTKTWICDDLWWFVMCTLQRALLKRALCTSFWESQLVSVRRGSCCVACRETAGMGKLQTHRECSRHHTAEG